MIKYIPKTLALGSKCLSRYLWQDRVFQVKIFQLIAGSNTLGVEEKR